MSRPMLLMAEVLAGVPHCWADGWAPQRILFLPPPPDSSLEKALGRWDGNSVLNHTPKVGDPLILLAVFANLE